MECEELFCKTNIKLLKLIRYICIIIFILYSTYTFIHSNSMYEYSISLFKSNILRHSKYYVLCYSTVYFLFLRSRQSGNFTLCLRK